MCLPPWVSVHPRSIANCLAVFWLNVWLAWAYVGFRVIHSLIQATVNIVRWRFFAHLAASLCLLALTVHAAMHILHVHH